MRKYKSRLEKWKEPIRVPCAYNTIDDIEFSNFLKNRSQLNFENRKITYDEMIGASKELIFDIRDGKPVFICINITLDTYKFDLVISEGWQTVPDEMNQEEIDEIKEEFDAIEENNKSEEDKLNDEVKDDFDLEDLLALPSLLLLQVTKLLLEFVLLIERGRQA